MNAAIENTPAAWGERARTLESELDVVGWTKDGQQSRFSAVLEALEPTAGELLVDFGCGTGALADRLPDLVGYLGYDWSADMLARARRERPDRNFSGIYPRSADVIACVGTFNLLPWTKQHTWHHIRHLWATTDCRALAACLYAGDDELCLTYTVEEAAAFATTQSRLTLATRHRANDILMVITR